MQAAVAHIDLSMPSGRRILRDLSGKKAVTIETPALQTGRAWRDVWNECLDKMTNHYGVDMRTLQTQVV